MQKKQTVFKSKVFIILAKLPVFLLALPFVVLMRVMRPVIWIRLISVSDRIGHGIGNIDVYLAERRAGMYPSKAMDIFYSNRPWKCNRQMIRMWKRLIPLYNFVYWIAWANLKISGWEPHNYNPPHRDRDIYGLTNDTLPPVSFTGKEDERGEILLRKMGIPAGSPIVCFHARDNSFLNAHSAIEDWTYHNHRDVDIDSYVPAIRELTARGYYAIRMGKVVKKPFLWKDPHVIDYAVSSWKSDFADMYLISRCNFYIGTSCGMDAVATFFRKQQVVLNMIPMKIAFTWSPNYFYIFKKLWLIQDKRFLTFHEMLDSEVAGYLRAIQYKKAGIEVVDNTPEEIFDVVIEKEERMRGCWKTNDEYEELQRRFWKLFKPDHLNRVFNARVGSKFLEQTKELLL
ncbi:MAG: TIGR04372 family glycosyltransferase [Candidatus Omnitrophota bacterium]